MMIFKTIRMPKELLERSKVVSEEQETTWSKFVRDAVEKSVKKYEKEMA
jgi:predicted DNA-binding protein